LNKILRKNILVIRSSDFQFYAANKLFSKKFIDLCIIENGTSVKTQLSINFKNIIKLLKTMLNPKNFIFRIYYFLMFKKFYGNNYLTVPEEEVHKFIQNKEIMAKVQIYHGPFANENDLIAFDNTEYVYYGNHLFNHYNAANISLDFFKSNYEKNKKYLSKFTNYIDFFSYPFGAKDTCYNYKTEDFLKKKLKPLKHFYADSLSFNKKKSQSYHRFILDNDTDENIFKSKVIFNKTKNIVKQFFRGNFKKS
jgi:hypothetical protein